jgi:cytochrome c-type biogenesis protein CcmH/NrfG
MAKIIPGGDSEATLREELVVWSVAAVVVAAIALAVWGKWGSEGSDFQRLERLEERVTQLEAER